MDIRTSDGYSVRLFAIGFTKKHKDHQKKTAYASSAQTRAIRKKMKEVMTKETANVDLHQLVTKLTLETIGKDIEKHTQAIYPLKDCLIRKVRHPLPSNLCLHRLTSRGLLRLAECR